MKNENVLILAQNPADRSATKRKLTYWVELAKLLERGGISGLFLADTNGGFDIYGGTVEESIRKAVQWPVTDPSIVRNELVYTLELKRILLITHFSRLQPWRR
jgi:predicted sugar kinase